MESILKQLSDLRGISGYEYRINEQIKSLIAPYCDEVRLDSLGNIIAFKKGRTSKQKIMLEAHMDEIGLMVSEIDKNGFLGFINIGGVDPRILPASEVTVHAKRDLRGVIGAKPPHLLSSGEADKSVKISDMAIDTGLSYDEVCELVSVGDSVTLSQSVGKMLNDTISLKTLDDRAGVCAVIEVFKRLGEIDADLYASISTQEEVGLRGAKVAAFEIFPDMAIAIDVCHAITPDNSKNAFEAGNGTVITIGPNIHPKMAEKLFELAKKYDVKTNTDVDDGDTGTDAWAIQVTKTGVPTALLSIPLKYMHTSVETMSMSDFEATIALIEHFVKDSDSFAEDWLCY